MKTNQQIAVEVIAGRWGVGEQRKKQLASAGYDPAAIQSIVNALMSGADIVPLDNSRILQVELDLQKYDGIKVVFT